jgi:hypothetical protein
VLNLATLSHKGRGEDERGESCEYEATRASA